MSHFKFEGDLSGVSQRQLEYISSVLEEKGFSNEIVSIEAVGQAGDNYVANVKRIIVERDGKKFKTVAKIAPTDEMMRGTANTASMFGNEHIMYTEVLPKLTELEKAADIPEKERLRYAACYGSFTEEPNEVILLEDLKESDFVMLDRFVSLTDDTVKIVLQNFAKIHSVSYALKNQEPEIFETIKTKLQNMWTRMADVPEIKFYFQSIEDDILNILDNDKYKRLIKGTVSQMSNHAVKCAKIDSKSRYSVIQQGDAWTNNIMFTLEDGKTVDCCMIDYQGSKESSPVADIQYMIFNCTDYETRSKHYHEWIDYYHKQLDKCLDNFGLKVNYIYPRDQLDADLKRYGKLSLCTAAMLSTILTRESADAQKFKTAFEDSAKGMTKISIEEMKELMESVNISSSDKKTVLKFKTRIEGLLESFIELGYVQ